MKGKPLPTGKLDVQILQRLLRRYSRIDERVFLGPGIGEDAAAIDMGEKLIIVATDPITFATSEIGYYSVMVNANDIVTTGAEPRWFTITILLPEARGNEKLVDSIFRQIHQACERLNISVIGGHTEITHGLDRPILVGQMVGEVQKETLITTAGAKPGDHILLSKGICIEGTSLIARERGEELLSQGITRGLIERARGFLFDPGISVVEEARLAFHVGGIHSMHDITEGGLANGLHELAMAAGVKIVVEKDRIPIYAESQILCEAMALDPMGVIASGALLVTASPPEADKILESARLQGISITKIGHIEEADAPSVTMVTSQGNERVPYFERDEVVKMF
ncbi:MAG: AIR synthase family protein [Deltaproteobacteria bacterium]|nr:MAG: AIR synthase family protein [Deltaproteobacteria bacterium]